VSRGDLQAITTDHCPFTRAEKETGLANYSQIPGGVPSMEMRLAAIYSQGVRSGRLTPPQWVDVCCTTPARLMGLASKGELAPGFDADVVIFDPDMVWMVSTETLHETADWTPYAGLTLHGRVQTTIVRGQIVVAKGQLQVEPGYGRYLHRARS
jgi:dihydropyrimidinase